MKTKTKGMIKVFSALLAFALILGSMGISMTAFAEEGDSGDISVVAEEQNKEADTEGAVGTTGAQILTLNETNYRAVCIALIIGCVALIAEVVLIRREVQKSNVRRGRRRRRRRR